MDAETWMDANKAVELGFADDILFRNARKQEPDEEDSDENEPDEEENLPFKKENTVLFSRRAVTNSLINKLAAHTKSKDAPSSAVPPQTEGRSIDELYNRLNIIKHHI